MKGGDLFEMNKTTLFQEMVQCSGPQHFWHQGLVSWKSVFFKIILFIFIFGCVGSSLEPTVTQMVKNPSAKQTWVRSLGWEDPLEKGMATHSTILAWKI